MLQSMGLQRVGHDWATEQPQHSFVRVPGGSDSNESACNEEIWVHFLGR